MMTIALSAIPTQAHAGGRIINGSEVSPSVYDQRWQFIVGLTYYGAGPICGGSLIDARTVVTAAHCIYDDQTGAVSAPESVPVLVGRRDLNSGLGQLVNVTQVVKHPSYPSSGGMRDDIAILHLATDVNVNFITPVGPSETALWGGGAGKTLDESTGAFIAGWGNTISGQNSQPSVLRAATIPIVSDQECGGWSGGGLGSEFAPTSMICGSILDTDGVSGEQNTNGVDTCQGDSGGPLIVGDNAGGYRLVGLTSWGYDCAGTSYGVYTRVDAYRDWINANRAVSSSSSTPPPTSDADRDEQAADTSAPSRPGKPAISKRKRGSIQMAWKQSQDSLSGVSMYLVFQKVGSRWKPVGRASAGSGARASYTAKRLRRGKKYAFRVQAVDRSGNKSAFSPTASFKAK
jgi:secreted trypsin-like serine protease